MANGWKNPRVPMCLFVFVAGSTLKPGKNSKAVLNAWETRRAISDEKKKLR